MWRRVQRAAIYMSSLFALSCFNLLFSFLCALPGTFATMGPAWPGTLAPERQVQEGWGAGSPPGNIDITSYGLTRRLKESPPEKQYLFVGGLF